MRVLTPREPFDTEKQRLKTTSAWFFFSVQLPYGNYAAVLLLNESLDVLS